MLKPGETFTHAHWLDEQNQPLRCIVTAVRHGVIYYKPVSGGTSFYFPIEEAARYTRPDTAPGKVLN